MSSLFDGFQRFSSYYIYVHSLLMEISQTASGFSEKKVVYYYRISQMLPASALLSGKKFLPGSTLKGNL